MSNNANIFKVLLIDSDLDRRKELLDILKNCGHSVSDAGDYKTGKDAVRRDVIDLVLCQDQLMGGSGLELLEWMRGNKSDMPFILMTERPNLPSAQKALAHDNTAVFDSPGNYSQLFPKLSAFQAAAQSSKVSEPTHVHPVKLSELSPQTVRGERANVDLVLDIPISVSVILGSTTMLVQELLQLGPGSVVELDKRAGEPIDICVNDKLLAIGEVVVVNETFGVRISEIVDPKQRVQALA